MRKHLARAALITVAALAGAAVAAWLLRSPLFNAPEPPTVVERMKEVARLETLHLSVYKKINFAPEPASSDTLWGDVKNWVRFNVRQPEGRAIVFAEVELGMDLERLTPQSVRIRGSTVEVVLPPTEAQVRLIPAETEVIDSNLDTEETAQLFDKAKVAFEREVMNDRKLMDRARASNERAIRALLITLGFREVVFVERLSGGPT